MRLILLPIALLIGLYGCVSNPKVNYEKNSRIIFEAHIGGVTYYNDSELVATYDFSRYLGKIWMSKDGDLYCDCLDERFQNFVNSRAWLENSYPIFRKKLILLCNEPKGVTGMDVASPKYFDGKWGLRGDFYLDNPYYKEVFLKKFFNAWIDWRDWDESDLPIDLYEIVPCVGEKYLRNKWTKNQIPNDILDAIKISCLNPLKFRIYTSNGIITYERETEESNIKCP
jgi:hypothetical protein